MFLIKGAAILCIAVCCFCCKVQAQKVCHDTLIIHVLDDKTGESVPGGAVLADSSNTVTDANGYGILETVCEGKASVTVTAISYLPLTKKITFSNGDTVTVFLKSNSRSLDAIEITGHKQALNTTTSVTTLHQGDLDKLKGGNLATALTSIAGVNMLQTGATIGKPVVNGMHSNRLLILNNGIRQEGQQWGSEHAPEIDPFIAQNISVVKGSEAIRYGAEAIGGVVIIEPGALPADSAIHAEVNAVGMSNGRSGTLSAQLSGNMKKVPALSWRVQGTVKESGNYKTPDYYLDNTGMRENNYSATLGYNKEHFGIDAFYSHFNTTLGIFKGSHIGSTEDLMAHIANGRPFDDGSFYYAIDAPKQEVVHDLLKVNGHLHLNDYLHFNVQYGFQNDNRKEYDVRRGGRSSIPSLNLTLLTHTLDASLEFYDGNQWKLTLGYNGLLQGNTYDAASATRQLIPDYNTIGTGVYAIGKYIRESYQLEGGIRYDYKYLTALGYRDGELYGGRHSFSNMSASLGIIIPASNHAEFRSNIGTAWRPPTVNELYSAGLHHGAADIEYGDSTLASEKSVKWINSLALQPLSWLHADIDAYLNYFDNYIYLNPTGSFEERLNGAFPVFRTEHTNARFLGLDASVRATFLKQFEYSLKASVIRAKDLSYDKYLPMIPADKFVNALQWKPAPPLRYLQNSYLKLEHVFVAKQTRYNINSDFAPPPDAYQLLNLSMGTELKLTKHLLSINFSIDNLTNTLYKDYMNRFRYYAHDIGRNVVLRLTYRI
jgi:iron complex outermembrane recepter protein